MFRKDRKIDIYTRSAQKQGYPARSVYKLKEINERFKVIKRGYNVLDLGCAPGSWLLYVSDIIGPNAWVLGVDIDEVKIPQRSNIRVIKQDIFDFKLESKFNAVVSDMAPNTTGSKLADSGKSLELSIKAFEIARNALAPNGNFVCKVFESKETQDFFKEVSKSFRTVKLFKPKAISKGSREMYIVAMRFIQ